MATKHFWYQAGRVLDLSLLLAVGVLTLVAAGIIIGIPALASL